MGHVLFSRLQSCKPESLITWCQVMLDGKVVATLERSCPRVVRLPEILVFLSDVTVLDIVVHAMGRNSGGCDWDPKGIIYPNVLLNGTPTIAVPL